MPGLSAEPFKSNVRLIGPEIETIMSVANLGKRTLLAADYACDTSFKSSQKVLIL